MGKVILAVLGSSAVVCFASFNILVATGTYAVVKRVFFGGKEKDAN